MPERSEAAYTAIGPRLTGQVGSTEWRVNIGMRLSVYSTDALADKSALLCAPHDLHDLPMSLNSGNDVPLANVTVNKYAYSEVVNSLNAQQPGQGPIEVAILCLLVGAFYVLVFSDRCAV